MIEVLTAAKSLIAKRGGWTKDEAARTRAGTPTQIQDPKACSFCTMGAIARASGAQYMNEIKLEISQLLVKAAGIERASHPPGAIMIWNDKTTTKKQDVLALFDRAIELAS